MVVDSSKQYMEHLPQWQEGSRYGWTNVGFILALSPPEGVFKSSTTVTIRTVQADLTMRAADAFYVRCCASCRPLREVWQGGLMLEETTSKYRLFWSKLLELVHQHLVPVTKLPPPDPASIPASVWIQYADAEKYPDDGPHNMIIRPDLLAAAKTVEGAHADHFCTKMRALARDSTWSHALLGCDQEVDLASARNLVHTSMSPRLPRMVQAGLANRP